MEGQGDNDELYPIAVLIDELKVNHPTLKPALWFPDDLLVKCR